MVHGTAVVKVFAWERTVQRWLAVRLAWAVRPLSIVNWVGGSEPLVLALALGWSVLTDRPLVALAAVASTVLARIAKETAARPRPVDDGWGLPSADVMIATAFWPHVLGVAAVPLIALVALARLVRGAHYPLDVVVGAGLGAALWALAR